VVAWFDYPDTLDASAAVALLGLSCRWALRSPKGCPAVLAKEWPEAAYEYTVIDRQQEPDATALLGRISYDEIRRNAHAQHPCADATRSLGG
jgi:hypothetical protein